MVFLDRVRAGLRSLEKSIGGAGTALSTETTDPSPKLTPGQAPDPALLAAGYYYRSIQRFDEEDLSYLSDDVVALLQLASENPYAAKYLRLLEMHVVGVEGPRLRLDGAEREQLAWEQWTSACFGMPWATALKVLLQSIVRDGDVFVVLQLKAGADGRETLRCKIYSGGAIDRDRVSSRRLGRSSGASGQIEYDADGQPVRYTFQEKDQLVTYPAEVVVHLYRRERATQQRGLSWLGPGIPVLLDLVRYDREVLEREVKAAKSRGKINVAPGSELPDPNAVGENQLPEQWQGTDVMVPGYTHAPDPLGAGFDATTIPTTRLQMLHKLAAALNISFAALVSDGSGGNMSSLRMLNLDDQKFVKTIQNDIFQHQLLDRLFAAWSRWYSMENVRAGSRLARARVIRLNPGFDYIEPTKQANADKILVETGIKSKQTVREERGLDSATEQRLIDQEREAEAELAAGEGD